MGRGGACRELVACLVPGLGSVCPTGLMFFVTLFLAAFVDEAAACTPFNLLLNYQKNPIPLRLIGGDGVCVGTMVFTWALPSRPECADVTSSTVRVTHAATGVAIASVHSADGSFATTESPTWLSAGTSYAWHVCVTGPVCSPPSYFVAGLKSWPGVPIWTPPPPNAQVYSGFSFVRSPAFVVPRDLHSAILYATAWPSAPPMHNTKLLATYKFWVDGVLVGMGPGRIGTCGPTCPIQSAHGPCTCQPEHVYEAYNVSTALATTQSRPVVIAVQTFDEGFADQSHHRHSSFHMALVATLSNGSTTVLTATSSQWQARSANPYFGFVSRSSTPSLGTGYFYQPSNNFDANREVVGWRAGNYTPSPPDWAAAAECPAYQHLKPRPTPPQQILQTGPETQAVVTPVAPSSGESRRWFVDFQREAMGGLRLAVRAGAGCAGTVLRVRMGEALRRVSPPAVRYRMSTGNVYEEHYTLRGGAQDYEAHEYSEWRYVEIAALAEGRARCAASVPGDYATPLRIGCNGEGALISGVAFASWGTPRGACVDPWGGRHAFRPDPVCDADVRDVVRGLCLGKTNCAIDVAAVTGADPCDSPEKRLAVAVECSRPPPSPPPTCDDLQIRPSRFVVRYDADFAASDFRSSDAALNAIWAFGKYTQRATTLDMYTDSNTRQRDVMCMESAHVNALMQRAVSAEWALPKYSLAYLLQQRGLSGPGAAEWPALAVVAVHEDWLATNDLSLFAAHYAQLRNWTLHELIDPRTGLWTCPGKGDPKAALGALLDCHSPEVDWPPAMRDGYRVTTTANTAVNSHVYRGLQAFVAMATALGTAAARADAALLEAKAGRLLQAAARRLFNGSVWRDGLDDPHTAWHASVFAQANGLGEGLAAPQRRSALRYIADRCRGTRGGPGLVGGMYPAHYAVEALYRDDADRGAAALGLLTANGTNSWLGQIRRGATTAMEAWTEEEKPNLTWSHPWGASPVVSIVRHLMGLAPLLPGWAHFRFKPLIGALSHAAVAAPTLRGVVEANATQRELCIAVPGNTKAELWLSIPGEGAEVCLNGLAVRYALRGAFFAVVNVSAGAWRMSLCRRRQGASA